MNGTLRKLKVKLPLIGYLILASGVAFTFQQERQHTNENTAAVAALGKQEARQVAQSTKATLIGSCSHGNDLRVVLRSLIAQEIPAIRSAVQKGRLTPKEASDAIMQVRGDLAKVKNVDCTKTYSKIH